MLETKCVSGNNRFDRANCTTCRWVAIDLQPLSHRSMWHAYIIHLRPIHCSHRVLGKWDKPKHSHRVEILYRRT